MTLTTQTAEEETISLTARDMMVKEVVMIDENASVKQSADVMNEREISSIIATRNGKPVGILTERDLLKRIVSEERNAKQLRVRDIMSSPLISIKPTMVLEEAANIMLNKKIKKLPVVYHNKIVGLLSLTDVARCQPLMMKVLKGLSAMQNAAKHNKKSKKSSP
jgi:CBS domain-containing protein